MYLNTVFKYNVFKYCPALMTINKIMNESAEKNLKVKMKITKEKAEEKDKKWMTEQIRKEIKKRK